VSLTWIDIHRSKSDPKYPIYITRTSTINPKMSSSVPTSNRLSGKVAIVTGGGSGFGEAISKRFSDEGCKVIVADMNPESGTRVSLYNQQNMYFVEMNVAKSNDWEKCLKECVEKFGRVDVVVNNAGTSYRNKVSFEWERKKMLPPAFLI
jgi:NAD(P)-dependent dehydrogenase (short-subunit alcohol dehydrogenase family)